jgi:hypothetical protein
LLPPSALASKLVLTIRAGNPAGFAQTVEVAAALPERVGTNDVLNTAGLDLEYDVRKDVYFVRKAIEFQPKEIRIFRVEIRDIWLVEDAEIARLRDHTRALVAKLKGTEYAGEGEALGRTVEQELDAVAARQKAALIENGASSIQHIRDYETNVRVVSRLKGDIAQIENRVMATGQDPGEMVGPGAEEPPPAREVRLPEGAYKIATIEVTVANPSTTATHRVSISRELPGEILATDVVDPGGLLVGTDPVSGRTFVYRDSVPMSAGEKKTYQVKVRDKWNINGPRIAELRANAAQLLGLVEQEDRYRSVGQVLTSLQGDLDRIEKQPGPEKLSPAYVAFYRRQGERLDLVEQTLNRIRSALRPGDMSARLGFNVKPPTLKTTWVVIYIVLGFLAVVSLVFFFRWFGRSRAEETGSSGQP